MTNIQDPASKQTDSIFSLNSMILSTICFTEFGWVLSAVRSMLSGSQLTLKGDIIFMSLLSFRKSLGECHKGCCNAAVESKGFK